MIGFDAWPKTKQCTECGRVFVAAEELQREVRTARQIRLRNLKLLSQRVEKMPRPVGSLGPDHLPLITTQNDRVTSVGKDVATIKAENDGR